MINHKFGYYAVFQGQEYKANSLQDGQIVLFSNDADDVQRGFVQRSNGRFVKITTLDQLSSAYYSQYRTIYQGEECSIDAVDSSGDYVLGYKDNYEVAERLGFKLREMNVYYKQVPANDVEEIWEERSPILGFQIPEDQRKIRIR